MTTTTTPRRARGATRSSVKFGNLLDAIGRMDEDDRLALHNAIVEATSAEELRALAAAVRKGMAESVARAKEEAAAHEKAADLVEKVSGLDDTHRTALVKLLEPRD